MAQFDSLIIFPLLWSLVLTLIRYYGTLVQFTIPSFFGAKKFRKKKLDSPAFYNSFFNSKLDIKINNSYNYIF